MDPNEKLSDLERACCDHLLHWLRGLVNARELWYLLALEQEHYASQEAKAMIPHVGKAMLVVCSVPGCNRDVTHVVEQKYYCREHAGEAQVEVQA